MNDLVKKWEPTGLLDERETPYPTSKELKEKRIIKNWREQVAEYLDEIVNELLVDDDIQSDNITDIMRSFSQCCIPLVRRIFDEGNGLKVEYEKLKSLFVELTEEMRKDYGDTPSWIDLESEVCALAAENYVEKYGEKNYEDDSD